MWHKCMVNTGSGGGTELLKYEQNISISASSSKSILINSGSHKKLWIYADIGNEGGGPSGTLEINDNSIAYKSLAKYSTYAQLEVEVESNTDYTINLTNTNTYYTHTINLIVLGL